MKNFLSDFKKLPKNNRMWILIVLIISFILGIISPNLIKIISNIGIK